MNANSDSPLSNILDKESYLSFATLKKSGDYVATPVWFAPGKDAYYLFSAASAGKVKRLRNFKQCQVAACTVTGSVTGDWIDGSAFLLDSPEDTATALAALQNKYGWQMTMTNFFSRLTGKMNQRIYIRVELPPAS